MDAMNRKNDSSVKKIAASIPALLLGAVACAVGYTLLLTAMKASVGGFIDQLTALEPGGGMLFHLLALLAGTALLGCLHGRLSYRCGAECQSRLYQSLICKAGVCEDSRTGEDGKVTTLMTQDVSAVTKCVLRILQRLIPDGVAFVASVYTLGRSSHWLLAAAIVLLCAVQMVVAWVVNDRINGKRHAFHREMEKANQTASYGIDNLEAVKAYGCEQRLDRDYQESFAEYSRLNVAINRATSALSAFSLAFTFTVMLLITVVCGTLAAKGRISIGAFFVALTMIDSILSPVMRFDSSIRIVLSARTNAERLYQFFSAPALPASGRLRETENKVEFQQVSFSYQPDQPVLREVSFVCVPGKCHYLLGKNGCGKSTAVKLLLGAEKPQAGNIYVLGNSVSQLSPLTLSQSIAVLTQDMVVLPTTVWDNLTLGAPYTKERVYAVCRAIGIHDEIEALPQGYATVLYDNGEPLSIGQRRRICITRTLLRDAPVYFFDEPSSGLDTDHVQLLKEAFRELAQNRIVLIITHDASLLEQDGNVIYVAEDSKNEK